MARAQQQPVELILPVFTQWERVGSVTGILADLEQGQFYTASLLVEQMMRDDRVKALLNTLIMSVLGSDRTWTASATKGKGGKPTAKAQRYADELAESWDEQVPEEELFEFVRWALMLGASIMRTPWDMRTGAVEARTWHPGALWFNLVDNEYYLRTAGNQILVERDSLDWLLLTPYSHKYGRLNGLVRAMSMLYLARQWTFRDRARHSEVHGMPIRQGITPSRRRQAR
jgi:phage gp29-like protein